MHELAIALDVIQSAVKAIPDNLRKQPVEKVTLDIGKMAGVTADSLRFCFEIAARGTTLESAVLVINDIPVNVRCRACQSVWEMQEPEFFCGKCGSSDISMETGRELFIRSIEVADVS